MVWYQLRKVTNYYLDQCWFRLQTHMSLCLNDSTVKESVSGQLAGTHVVTEHFFFFVFFSFVDESGLDGDDTFTTMCSPCEEASPEIRNNYPRDWCQDMVTKEKYQQNQKMLNKSQGELRGDETIDSYAVLLSTCAETVLVFRVVGLPHRDNIDIYDIYVNVLFVCFLCCETKQLVDQSNELTSIKIQLAFRSDGC